MGLLFLSMLCRDIKPSVLVHKRFSGIQMGLWAMIWFYDYYGVIRLFIRKSYIRGLLMITTGLGWQNSLEVNCFFTNVGVVNFKYQPKLNDISKLLKWYFCTYLDYSSFSRLILSSLITNCFSFSSNGNIPKKICKAQSWSLCRITVLSVNSIKLICTWSYYEYA